MGKGMTPVRIELADGSAKWRPIRDLTNHVELCRAFGLSEVHTSFDLPSSARGTGSYSTGNRGNLRVCGYILHNGEPIGKLYVAKESEKFRDYDATNTPDFWKL